MNARPNLRLVDQARPVMLPPVEPIWRDRRRDDADPANAHRLTLALILLEGLLLWWLI